MSIKTAACCKAVAHTLFCVAQSNFGSEIKVSVSCAAGLPAESAANCCSACPPSLPGLPVGSRSSINLRSPNNDMD